LGSRSSKIGEKMKLSDQVIGHIAQLVQLAILTGTDVVDHMRMVVLTENEGSLFLNEEYEKQSEDRLTRMIEEVNRLQAELVEN
jgi:hypothetical protein